MVILRKFVMTSPRPQVRQRFLCNNMHECLVTATLIISRRLLNVISFFFNEVVSHARELS